MMMQHPAVRAVLLAAVVAMFVLAVLRSIVILATWAG